MFNNVEATFDFVERIVRLAAFNNVASTLLLVWTGLYGGCRERSHVVCRTKSSGRTRRLLRRNAHRYVVVSRPTYSALVSLYVP